MKKISLLGLALTFLTINRIYSQCDITTSTGFGWTSWNAAYHPGTTDIGQPFTASANGTLTAVKIYGITGATSLSIVSGTSALGPVLYTENSPTFDGSFFHTLTTPLSVSIGSQYTVIINSPIGNYSACDINCWPGVDALYSTDNANTWLLEPNYDFNFEAAIDCNVTTNISELNNHLFTVYPNPTNGEFAINLRDVYSNVRVSISDISGRLIETKDYNNTQFLYLQLNHPSGTYILKIESEIQSAVLRIVKE